MVTVSFWLVVFIPPHADSFQSLPSAAVMCFLCSELFWSWLQSDSVQPESVSSLMLLLLQVMLSCSFRRRVRSRPSLTPASRRMGNSTCVSRAPLLKISQWVKHCHSTLKLSVVDSASREICFSTEHCSEEIRYLKWDYIYKLNAI